MTSWLARESEVIKYCKPVEGFWIVYGSEEDEGGEEMKFNRRSPAAKYPYPAPGANRSKQRSK